MRKNKVELTGFLADLAASDRMAPVEDATEPTCEYDLEVRNLNVWYGNFQALRNVNVGIADRNDHGDHRALRLRQEHADPLPQPHERPHPQLPR